VRVAAIQHDIVWEHPDRTRDQVRPMIARAAADGARLVVLSEMYATGFSMRPERIGEDEGGANEQFLLDQAGEHGITVIASIAQRGADGQYRNNAVVAGADGSTQRYAKIHPFGYGGEDKKYAAGDRFLTVDVDGLRVSTFICYDLRFADEFWALAEQTDAFVVPANWPEPRHLHWRVLLQARAIENQCYVIGVNRVGLAKDLPHAGGSAIIDPLGERLAEGREGPEVLCAEVDPAHVRQVREQFPFLPDRR
jgi:predicted amidohydrolase